VVPDGLVRGSNGDGGSPGPFLWRKCGMSCEVVRDSFWWGFN